MSDPLDPKAVASELKQRLSAAVDEFVPWYLSQMSPAYFEHIDAPTRSAHMALMLALRAAGQEPWLRMRSRDGNRMTYVLPEDHPGMLTTLMRDFGEATVRAARIYQSRDGSMSVDEFDLGGSPLADPSSPEVRAKIAATMALAAEKRRPLDQATLERHFRRLDVDYVRTCTPHRVLVHLDLYEEVAGSAGAAARLESDPAPNRTRVILAVANIEPRRLLARTADLFGMRGLNIIRAYVDAIHDEGERTAAIVSAVVEPASGSLEEGSPAWQALRTDLLRLPYLDADTITLGYKEAALGLGGADVLHTYADLAHQLLVKVDRYAYGRSHVREILEQHLPLAVELVRLFEQTFDPTLRLPADVVARRTEEARVRVESAGLEDVERTVFQTVHAAIVATRRTNHYVVGRSALSLRLDPALFAKRTPRADLPYGVYFVRGRSFAAFHARFRDIARGGVRVVIPASPEQHTRERERHFDEVYELAFAQQLKNKDIPEGGAKAVILVEPGRVVTRCVRAFVDAMLDLIVDGTSQAVVDRLGSRELLYFGPDENITPDHIVWIAARAKTRGYAYPDAIMSSKPGAGINHKEYGVTSEGVAVFLGVGLRAVGIDPTKTPFSVKITGGPDGDVGGNMLKILFREYGDRVHVVGIADGSGSAEDPSGLDRAELMRLVGLSAPIAQFDRARLSPAGRVVPIDAPDGALLRNELHNRVVADAFLPCGGRPSTMNGSNWQRFLRADGTPTSRLIVEGANLFLTPEARSGLATKGVYVVKDSSANKCGVICSSFEVLANLLVDTDTLLEIKPQFVREVVDRLRELARLEAELLFDAHRRDPSIALPEHSVRLSREVNRVKDALTRGCTRLREGAPSMVEKLAERHLPPTLAARAGARVKQLPDVYLAHLVGAVVTAQMLYREGLELVAGVPEDALVDLAIAWLSREERTEALVAEVERSGLADKAEIARLLHLGGTRAALRLAAG